MVFEKIKILGAVLELPALPIQPISLMGWIGRAI